MTPPIPRIITLEALMAATSTTRREVAREWWARCTQEAKQALLNDENGPVKVEAIYSARNEAVMLLAADGTVTEQCLRHLDRGGRFRVCVELWHVCTPEAKHALLNDAHPHVRSAAVIEHDSDSSPKLINGAFQAGADRSAEPA